MSAARGGGGRRRTDRPRLPRGPSGPWRPGPMDLPARGRVMDLGALTLNPPVLVDSGCGGTGRELDALGGLAGLGAFVTRSITLDAREGGTAPRIVGTPSGLVNAVGLQNPGIDQFLARELPWLAAHEVTANVSVAGSSIGEYADLGRRLGRSPGVAGKLGSAHVCTPVTTAH